jgi:sec-independent protein translocase protein TatB
MKRVSFSETIFLFFLALIIFGPKKLPEIARQIGKVLNEFRRASNEFKSQIEQEIAHLEVEKHQPTVLQPSLPPDGTASRTMTAGSELGPAETPATLAASSEASQPATPPAPATEAVAVAETPATEAVSPTDSQQESHA